MCWDVITVGGFKTNRVGLQEACSQPVKTAAPTPVTTAAPILAARASIPFPTFLSMGPEELFILCSCVITSANPTTTITQSNVLSLNSYSSVTRVVTQIYTITDNKSWSTVYVSGS
jgi:hypothetical protein